MYVLILSILRVRTLLKIPYVLNATTQKYPALTFQKLGNEKVNDSKVHNLACITSVILIREELNRIHFGEKEIIGEF